MKTDLENQLFSTTVNPLIKFVISHVDKECHAARTDMKMQAENTPLNYQQTKIDK